MEKDEVKKYWDFRLSKPPLRDTVLWPAEHFQFLVLLQWVFAPTERFPPALSFNTEVTDVRIQPVLVECSLPMALDNHLGPFQPKLFHDSNKEIISCG